LGEGEKVVVFHYEAIWKYLAGSTQKIHEESPSAFKPGTSRRELGELKLF
jgi:hypothetical protein